MPYISVNVLKIFVQANEIAVKYFTTDQSKVLTTLSS